MSMKTGLRVFRGPHWKWENQNMGHLGTVSSLAGDREHATVNWDPENLLLALLTIGDSFEYRTGKDHAYDLRVYCSSEAGVRHENVLCDYCEMNGIKGIRWKCSVCDDYDLCSVCYHSDMHNTCHQFIRIDHPGHTGMKLSPRCDTKRYEAPQMRTSDWAGGRPANGDIGYYKDHLPILGLYTSSHQARTGKFSVGDKVAVTCSVADFKNYQSGHGGINDTMIRHRGEDGVIIHLSEAGNPAVQFEGCGKAWYINPQALTKRGGCTCSSESGDIGEALGRLLIAGALINALNK